MLTTTGAFSGFSIKDVDETKEFYENKLGLTVEKTPEGLGLNVHGVNVFLYPKEDHVPASFTVLNFEVADISRAVDELTEAGIAFEQYGGDVATDERGIMWGKREGQGPNIAWFKDPSENILSILEG